MNHDTQVELIERVQALLAERTTEMIDHTGGQRSDRYWNPDRAERELDVLFRRAPIIAGHVSQVSEPGQFFTHDATGVPLLVARGDDGLVRAFLNVCRHRGTRVVDAACGAAKSFACPYHGWTYGRDGSLLAIPQQVGFPGCARRDLVEVPVAEHAGFVWVVATPGVALDAADYLGPMGADFSSDKLADHVAYAQRDLTRELNWKLVIDLFLETYHLRVAHRRSIYPMFFDNVGIVDRFEPHMRNVVPKRTIRTLDGLPASEWRLRDHANVLYLVFPNTLVLMEPDHAAVMHVFPTGPERCRILAYTLIPQRAASDKARRYWKANNDILYAATEEDLTLGESIQRGVRSGANETVVFGRYEHGLTYFHQSLDQRLAADG